MRLENLKALSELSRELNTLACWAADLVNKLDNITDDIACGAGVPVEDFHTTFVSKEEKQ